MKYQRVFLMVIDGLGVGELPDAEKFGDVGANTLGNVVARHPTIKIPHLVKFGLGNILQEPDLLSPVDAPAACFGRARELNYGKDTVTGHWEMMGVRLETPFRTFPKGFPEEIISEFERRTGRKVIGNKVISGTVILDELGEEHMKTGALIVYTSADSVFQIAAHQEVVPLEELYRYCEIAREMLQGEWFVGRVIARPFIGEGKGRFTRTPNRKDFIVPVPRPNLVHMVHNSGLEMIGVGKIGDIFKGEGFTQKVKQKSNSEGLDHTERFLREDFKGFCFINLIDTDMLYGHRMDAEGYARALEEIDARLPEIVSLMKGDDLMIIVGDHGNDPTLHTDHTREYVPILAFGPSVAKGENLGVRDTFADVGSTIAENFGLPPLPIGASFLHRIRWKLSA